MARIIQARTMKNAIEKAAIARNVADYIIDHLLVEEPMNAAELIALAIDVTEDRGITEANELESIAAIVVSYVSTDRRVESKSKDGTLWIHHEESV